MRLSGMILIQTGLEIISVERTQTPVQQNGVIQQKAEFLVAQISMAMDGLTQLMRYQMTTPNIPTKTVTDLETT